MSDDKLNSLESILGAISKGLIDYGPNKTYFFFLDEDGDLTFLKRVPDSERDQYFEEEDLKHWPLNESDGLKLWSTYCGEHRGTSITSALLKIMNVEVGGAY